MSDDDRAGRMRAALLKLVIGIVAVDVVGALAVRFTSIGATQQGRTIAVAVWLLVTFAVILPPLKEIRALRRRR